MFLWKINSFNFVANKLNWNQLLTTKNINAKVRA